MNVFFFDENLIKIKKYYDFSVSMSTIAIFHASKTPNEFEQWNWFEFKSVPELNLKLYYETIKCSHITMIPNIKKNCVLTAIADDNGLANPISGRNDLAGGALFHLGFRDSHVLGMAYAGTVIVVGNKNKGLSQKQQTLILDAIAKYRKDDSETETDDEIRSEVKVKPKVNENKNKRKTKQNNNISAKRVKN